MSQSERYGLVSFAVDLKANGLPEPACEYRFHPSRKWRFDFAWPDRKLAVEIDGGTWAFKPSHSGGAGHRRDCEKRNAAVLLGWRVLTYSTDMLPGAPAQIAEVYHQ